MDRPPAARRARSGAPARPTAFCFPAGRAAAPPAANGGAAGARRAPPARSFFGQACCRGPPAPAPAVRFPRAAPVRRARRRRPPTCAAAGAGGAGTGGAGAGGGLYAGAVVEVALSANRVRVAVAQRPDGKRNWIVTDAAGTSASVAPRQVTFHLGGTDELGEDLAAVEAAGARLATDSAELLSVAWEILADAGAPVEVPDVADVVFGSVDRASLYAAHVLLQRDRTYFKARAIKGTTVYEPRPPALVREAALAAESEAARAAELERTRANLGESIAKRDIALARAAVGAPRVAEITAVLEKFAEDPAAHGGSAKAEAAAFQALGPGERDAVRFALGAAGCAVAPAAAFDVLVAWGTFAPHENLVLRRLALAGDLVHSAELAARGDKLLADELPADSDAVRRMDLTHLAAFAVDSADTTEVDDAVSWDAERGAVWVHVADATRFFPEGRADPLVQDALRRVATLYLPTGKYPMFPERVATQLLSLGAPAGDGTALSFGFRVLENGLLDEDNLLVTCSRIAPPRRFTYEEFDELLVAVAVDGAPDPLGLAPLLAAAERWQKARVAEGAHVVQNPFCSVTIENEDAENPEIALKVVKSDSKSWMVVSELMIAACAAAGIYAEDNNVGLVFRGQAEFDAPSATALAAIPEGPARTAALFRKASPSSTGLEPMSHASLGVDTYAQVTSPIRRSVDLIAHLQLKAHIRGEEAPFDAVDLGKEIGKDADRGRRIRTAENRTTKYWQLEYIRRLPQGTEVRGTFVRMWKEEERRGLVYLDDYGFDVFLQVPAGVMPGDRCTVVFTSVNPRGGNCRASIEMIRAESQVTETGGFEELVTSDVEVEEAFP